MMLFSFICFSNNIDRNSFNWHPGSFQHLVFPYEGGRRPRQNWSGFKRRVSGYSFTIINTLNLQIHPGCTMCGPRCSDASLLSCTANCQTSKSIFIQMLLLNYANNCSAPGRTNDWQSSLCPEGSIMQIFSPPPPAYVHASFSCSLH